MIGLIGWGRFFDGEGNRITTPPGLWRLLRLQAPRLGASYDFVLTPPPSLAQGGAGAGCDGYGVAWRWNLGWNQPTRYGTLEELLAMIGALAAHGSRTWVDLVLHQLLGPENGGPGVSTYVGADGKTHNGRGPTTPGWFRGRTQPVLDADGNPTGEFKDPIPPFCAEDDVPSRSSDFPFGREISYENCTPENVTLADAVGFTAWLRQRLGVGSFRIDDVKGTYAPAIAAVAQEIVYNGGACFAEYFDNTDNALGWATRAPMNGLAGVEDFDWHFRLQAACNQFDARQLFAGGTCVWQRRPDLAMLFVENPDTDTSPGQQIVFNKLLAYAVTLCLPAREAVVYGKDYFPNSIWPGAYGLWDQLDNIAWFAGMFAFGGYYGRWLDRDVFAFSRDGNGGAVGWSGGLLVAVNFNVLAARTITVGTTFGPNAHLHDYSGHIGDVWTDMWGNATFTLPSNAYSSGRSYVLLAPAGVSKPVARPPLRVSQTFVGDGTIDVLKVSNGILMLPQQMWFAEGPVTARLQLDRNGLTAGAEVQVEILDLLGEVVASAATGPEATATATGTVTLAGWHTLRLVGSLLPMAGTDFTLTVTYLGGVA